MVWYHGNAAKARYCVSCVCCDWDCGRGKKCEKSLDPEKLIINHGSNPTRKVCPAPVSAMFLDIHNNNRKEEIEEDGDSLGYDQR